MAVFLLWVYYSAQIFLLGAEFTWVIARRRSGQGAPAPAADGPRRDEPRAEVPSGLPPELSTGSPNLGPLAAPLPAWGGAGRVMKQLGIGAALGAAAGALMGLVASRRRARARWLPEPAVADMPLHARRSP